MIAKNYIKHPEALRVQRELFFIGHHNSPLIMRLMGCIFSQAATTPEWFKAARAKAKALAKTVKKTLIDWVQVIAWEVKAKGRGQAAQNAGFELRKIKGEILTTTTKPKNKLEQVRENFKPALTVSHGHIKCAGHYRNFCQKRPTPWASFTPGTTGAYAAAAN